MSLAASSASFSTPNGIQSFPLVPHHVQRMRRRHLLTRDSGYNSEGDRPTIDPTSIRRRESAQQVGALYQGYGTHYVDLWCGTPPQRQTVIVDTGSGVTAFPCSACSDCGVPRYHIDSLFDEAISSTFQHKTCSNGCVASRSRCSGGECKISMAYAEGSRWDAFEAVDSCYIGGMHDVAVQDDGASDDLDPRHVVAFDLVFGCQTLVTGLFKTQLADGIMGMDSRQESYWAQMFAAGKMGTDKQFSLCFSRSPTAERKGTEAGALTLGGVDERFDKSPMVYTPAATNGREGFFSVRIRRVYLRDGSAGESAKSSNDNPSRGVKALEVSESVLNMGGVIVDSGTTDTYWNRAIAAEFTKVFKDKAGFQYHNKEISLNRDGLTKLPTILFQLESSEATNAGMDAFKTAGLVGSLDPKNPFDVLLAFPPSHYMEYDPTTDKYTSRFYVTEGGGSVLGANAIMGHNVLFDSDNDRIGWAESDCDYTQLVTSSGYDFPITGTLLPPPPPSSPAVPAPVVPSKPSTTVPVALPTAARPVVFPVAVPTVTTAEMKEKTMKYIQDCNTIECRGPIITGLLVFLCFSSCLFYVVFCLCCPCFRRTPQKYFVPTDNVLELTDFRDEPIEGQSDHGDAPYRDDDEDDDSSDEELPKTEFEGDFA